MTGTSAYPIQDARTREMLRAKEDLWARAFCLPGSVALDALLDWIEGRP